MNVSVDDIKKLRELTGVGLTDAKKALVETDGDFDKALEAMRKKGLTKAEKKGDREAREGLIEGYVHSGRIGVVVEVNCETWVFLFVIGLQILVVFQRLLFLGIRFRRYL